MAFLTMTKTNCKLLIRSIGFLLCLVLLPVGASALHMIQTSDSYTESHGSVTQVTNLDGTVIMETEKVSLLAVDASDGGLSELFLNRLAGKDWCSVYCYKSGELSVDELKSSVKTCCDRSFVSGVLYIPADFSDKLMAGQKPELIILNCQKDGRFAMLTSLINKDVSVMASCAASSGSEESAAGLAAEAFDKMPSVRLVTEEDGELSMKQTDRLRDIGYSTALLSLAFLLTGCFAANLAVTESENKALLRIEMSGVSMIKYVGSKALTAVLAALSQTAVAGGATAVFVGTDLGIPFFSYLLLIGMMGIIFNLLALVFGLFIRNTTFTIYLSFGVWVFSNLLSSVYFDFVTMPDWWERLGLLMPQKWVMIGAEAIMKGQSGAYSSFLLASAGFLAVILTAGYLAARLTDGTQKD